MGSAHRLRPEGLSTPTRVSARERPRNAKGTRLAGDGVASRPARETGQLTSCIRLSGRMCHLSRAIDLVRFWDPTRITSHNGASRDRRRARPSRNPCRCGCDCRSQSGFPGRLQAPGDPTSHKPGPRQVSLTARIPFPGGDEIESSRTPDPCVLVFSRALLYEAGHGVIADGV